ncbi:MAG TPA: outer membrane beta-barrel protein [Bryobacteraceae bacterium]|nr:outer membrane beta-barrel protein [Bryobacteraceae bacterium]
MLLFANGAHAQQATASTPQVEVSGSYSYIRANAANSAGSFNLNGASGSVAYNVSDRFSVVGDVGGYRFSGLPSGLSSTMYTFLFGPRYSFRKVRRFTPFAHVLLGVGRVNASSGGIDAGENGFSMAMGGGLDLPFRRRFALRVIQAEYLLTRFDRVTGDSATQNDLRISAGLVVRFGSR